MDLIKRSAALLLMLISFQSFAALVYIENDTDSICKLESRDLKHGILVTYPPIRIHPSELGVFRMTDSGFRGPEIELFYNCGGKKINITSQENMWIIWAGSVSAKIDYADPGITATYQLESGSALWNQAGVIRWVIFNNN